MATSMTRRQFLARALGTLAITSSCTAVALRPKTKLGVLWSPTFVVYVSDADLVRAQFWMEAFERKLDLVDPPGRDLYRIYEVSRIERDCVWQAYVSVGRFVQVERSGFYRAHIHSSL